MQQDVLNGLKKIPLFAKLSDEVLVTLAERAKSVKYPKNATIFMEGDETNSLYIILSGKVRVYSSDDKSKEVTLMIQESGSYFGEVALLSDEPRSASVSTLDKTVCATISKTDFIKWLMLNPEISISLLSVLTDKIRQLTEKVRLLALFNVYERTIITLQEMAVEEGNVKVIHNKLTQQDLADMVGASREMVNKIMQELTKGGYVSVEDKTLVIHKKLPASW